MIVSSLPESEKSPAEMPGLSFRRMVGGLDRPQGRRWLDPVQGRLDSLGRQQQPVLAGQSPQKRSTHSG